VPGETRTLRSWPILAGALLIICGLVPARVAADSASTIRGRASQLAQLDTELAAKSRSALLDLYALDSRLARERTRLVALRIRTSEVRAEREAAQHRLGIARRSLAAARLALSRRLQELYEQGDSDPVAVLLGASSVDDALSSLDSLDRIADQDRRVILQTRNAREQLKTVTRALAAREAELRRLAGEAERSTLAIQRSRTQRVSYLAGLSAQRRLNAAAISALQRQAQAVEARAQQLAAAAAGRGNDGGPGPAVGRTLTVVATGYSLGDRTATGTPVGWGVVAVDPSVIPLGTRMTIPGYGEGVASDTGSAVQGATIDLWFPTPAQAAGWGRRTVTITLR
jgi:3D (Asp-Asp-Asp) domain-containing protein/peptidoglycan hydrolase CwlO-like protein